MAKTVLSRRGELHKDRQGNMVTVTDPKGAWKKYTTDVLGNLVQVIEQGPGVESYDTFLRPARMARFNTVW